MVDIKDFLEWLDKEIESAKFCYERVNGNPDILGSGHLVIQYLEREKVLKEVRGKFNE